jgi:hypothetical protein
MSSSSVSSWNTFLKNVIFLVGGGMQVLPLPEACFVNITRASAASIGGSKQHEWEKDILL